MLSTSNTNRLKTLKEFGIISKEIREELSGLTDLASEICDAPISLINILDDEMQYTKAQRGIDFPDRPREETFCQYTINENGLLVIPDTTKDRRVKDYPFVNEDPKIRFYAGAPLNVDDNISLGALCILDTKPRNLTDVQKRSLIQLADEVVARLTLIKNKQQLKKQNANLKKAAKFLDNSSDIRLIVDAHSKEVIKLNNEANKYFKMDGGIGKKLTLEELLEGYNSKEKMINFIDSNIEQQGIFLAKKTHPTGNTTSLEFSLSLHGDKWYITARDISAREKTRKQLEETQIKKDAILNSSADAIITVNKDEEIIEFNPAAEKIFQFSKEEIQGKKLSETIVPKRHEEAHERGMQYYIKTGEGPIMGRLVELPALRKDGTEFPIEIQVNHIGDTDPPQFMAVIRDITERRKNQEKLRQAITNLNIGQDLANVGSFRWDRDKDYLQWSEKVFDIYGIDDVSIKPTTDLLLSRTHPDDLEWVQQRYSDIVKGAEFKEFEHRLLLDGGQIRWVRLTGKTTFGDDGNPKEIYGAVQNITDQKENEKRLQQAKALSDKIIDSLPNAFFMFDKDGNAIRWNDELQKRTGYNGQEISYMNPLDFVKKEHHFRVKKGIAEIFANGHATTEADVLDRHGNTAPYLFSASSFKTGGKEFIIGTGQNIAPLKKYEHRLENSLEEKKVLLSEIHHRVKNNLAIISGLLQLETFDTDNPSTQKTLSNTQLRIQSMATVHEMLYEAQDFNDLPFEQFISNIIESVETIFGQPHSNISFDLSIEQINLNINQAIPCGLIINEVVTNAYNHAFPDEEGEISVELTKTGDEVTIKIEDNGRGLPENFSISESDSLGFSLIKQLTQQLDADLDLHSETGTTFTITFSRNRVRGSGSAMP
ncbi:PAS domain S-box protein [Fodinibius sp. Rm-B-1B1-1]|uniref:PAS domain S-box protein n=1 Tax=Fodinibius alkaliphilus TaxID=3140241 RepID=UPI003159D92E